MRVRADVAGTLPRDTTRLRVDAESAADLRRSSVGPLGPVRSRQITVVVASWQPPAPAFAGRLGPLPGVLSYEIGLPAEVPGRVSVRVNLAEPLPFAQVAGAVLGVLVPTGHLPVPVKADVAAYGPVPAWLPPWDNVAPVVGDSPDEKVIRPYDVEVRDAGPTLDGRVVLDATVANPRGYRAGAGAVDLPGDGPSLVELAATGVVVHTPDPQPAAVAASLAPELLGIMAEPLPGDGASATEWEARSVRQRRAALRGHAAAWALPVAAGLPDAVRTPSVSALLVLTGPDTAAVRALASQTYPSLEILVAAPDELVAGVRHVLAGVSNVDVVPLSVDPEDAYDDLANRAAGSLITSFAEDAGYGPEHVWDLVLAMHYSGATVVGKPVGFRRAGPDTVVRVDATATERYVDSFVDGPMLVARSELARAGGWRRIAARPGYLTHPFGYVAPAQGPAGSRSATDSATLPLTLATS